MTAVLSFSVKTNSILSLKMMSVVSDMEQEKSLRFIDSFIQIHSFIFHWEKMFPRTFSDLSSYGCIFCVIQIVQICPKCDLQKIIVSHNIRLNSHHGQNKFIESFMLCKRFINLLFRLWWSRFHVFIRRPETVLRL